jgi:hypothetical protein
MKRRQFLKATGLMATFPVVDTLAAAAPATPTGGKQIYEWRMYTLTNDDGSIDSFYKDVFIPAHNRLGVKVGAFKLYEEKGVPMRFCLFIYPDITTYYKVRQDIWKDAAFRKASQPFYDKTAVNPAYKNVEIYLCEAFDKIPTLKMPDKSRTLFHLRHYASPNEEANQRKVKMFNDAEIEVFDKVGVNPVCYGEVLAGARNPSLMYLTWYKDKATHDAAWKAFGSHPGWIAIKDLPEYAHTATDNVNRLLLPMDYSQI